MNIANIKPVQTKEIPWGWENEVRNNLTFVSKHPGKIKMPDLLSCFDWTKFEVTCSDNPTQILGTKDMKSVFTTAARFLGYEKLLAEQPDLSEITNIFYVWNSMLLQRFPQIQYFVIGDDVAGNDGLLMSPGTWREWIKPELEDLIELANEHDCKVIYHSDGDIFEIMDDLSGMNIFAINFQPIRKMRELLKMDKYEQLELFENDKPWEGTFAG